MHKFKRIYCVVLLLTATLSIVVCKRMSAVNISLENGTEIAALFTINDTIPKANVLGSAKDTTPAIDTTNQKNNIPSKDSLPGLDTNITDSSRRGRIDTFTLKISKDAIDAPIKYHAADSAVGMIQDKTIELYGSAKTEYQNNSLEAPYMRLNQATGIVSAKSKVDSLGEISEYVKMNDGQSEYQSDSLDYNFKTQRGLIRGTVTQQGEMFLHSEVAKKIDSNTVYALGNFFTTCNLDHPHFGFRARRAKIINKKLAVTGAVHPEFDSVPVPIYLPFGFYPLYQGRHSGVMAPSFQTVDQEGLGLQGLGYYQVINDYWDVKAYGDIYSYGTWRLNVNPTYRKIYKYQGSLNLGVQHTKRNLKNDPDFYSSNTYTIGWTHSSDTRSRPGVTFSGNVNYSSTNYNRNLATIDPITANTMSSSITYSKQWIDKPYNLTLSMNHSQNNSTHLMTINFPTANFSVSTIYPFQKKNSVGTKKWYEQLGIGYNGSFRNDFNFYDTIKYKRDRGISPFKFLWDTARWSANHNIPITLSLPPILGGAVVVAPSISYSQEWVDRITEYHWGPQTLRMRNYNNTGDSIYVKDTLYASYNKAFKIKQQTSFGISFNTALYGTYQFDKKRTIQAIRHIIRPTFGLSYTPDMTRPFWKSVQIDSSGTQAAYNQLEGLYSRPMGQFISRQSGGINFGLDNNLEMKVRVKPKKKKELEKQKEGDDNDEADAYADNSGTSDQDIENGIKKVKLIDGFGFNGSYNFLADSMKLSPIAMYFRTNLFDIININASATLVPYRLNDYGSATKEYAWSGAGGFKVGTVTNASLSMSTSFQSKPKDAEKDKARKKAINQALNDPMLQADQQRLLEYMQQNPAEFVDFNTPWSVNLSFSLNYSRRGRNIESFQSSSSSPVTASTNFSGSFNLTPKWNFSVNGYYDFTTNRMQTISMAISRDLHCWQMSINVSPIGLYSRYFSFTISPKAGILQDLKINRTRNFYTANRY